MPARLIAVVVLLFGLTLSSTAAPRARRSIITQENDPYIVNPESRKKEKAQDNYGFHRELKEDTVTKKERGVVQAKMRGMGDVSEVALLVKQLHDSYAKTDWKRMMKDIGK